MWSGNLLPNKGFPRTIESMKSLKLGSFAKPLNISDLEHTVLDYWDETHAFEKSVEKNSKTKQYVFYDGPPFATGLPHYGHILASTIKDVVPRYFTMKGYRVERVWGWDCHGIPIENMVEKELGLKGGKKAIEDMGIGKFNAQCRSAILRFDTEWEKIIRRIGRWVNFKDSYKTMDKTYMESVWWAFKSLYEKGLIYEGRRVILYCPRCGTPLSNFEIAMDNSYKDVEDNSVFVKFFVSGTKNEYFIAWTTTPWTLIGNVALAVDPEAWYAKVHSGEEYIWIAEKRKDAIFGKEVEIIEKKQGKKLVGIAYEPLYTYMQTEEKKAYYVAPADFVSLEDGTGIVHTAAIFGEDDYRLAVSIDLPCVPTLDEQGKFLEFVEPLKGVFYKKAESWIIEDLTKRGLMHKAEKTIHSYPFCYRCETPLYFNAVPAWFINVQHMKKDMLKQNENIHWYPSHLKYGRFGKGLEDAPDWNISRSRFWGTPMPVWVSQSIKSNEQKVHMRIIGSVEELKTWAVDPKEIEKLTDIHREFLDGIEVWVDDEKKVKGKRISEVFDCWVESGSMPYASIHYPFENKQQFENTHPSQFIAEYIAQTRAWFYTLHVMSVGLFGTHTFENAVTTGTILAEDGTKMSKSKNNYPDPSILFEKYGVDALRFYLMGSVIMKAENLNFSEDQVKEVYQKLINILLNVLSFYILYGKGNIPTHVQGIDVLDQWIISKTCSLIKDATVAMNAYDTVRTCRLIMSFVSDLSQWYVRRSRTKIKHHPENSVVLGWVLVNLSKIMAPIVPFISECIYQNISEDQMHRSVHLSDWPSGDDSMIHTDLEWQMSVIREMIEHIHAKRKEAGIAVRQPLQKVTINNQKTDISNELIELIKEETNIKEIAFVKGEGEITVELDTTMTLELEQEGKVREVVRKIQTLRKEKGCRIEEKIVVTLPRDLEFLGKLYLEEIIRDTLSEKILWGDTYSISTSN